MNPSHIELRAQQRANGKQVTERPKLASRPFRPDMSSANDRANAARMEAYAIRRAGAANPLLQLWSA